MNQASLCQLSFHSVEKLAASFLKCYLPIGWQQSQNSWSELGHQYWLTHDINEVLIPFIY